MDGTKETQVGDAWYRYEDVRHASFDEDGDVVGDVYVQLYLRTYYVTKVTPKGVWLSSFVDGGKHRFVRLDSRKCFANPTKEAALASFRARKAAQMRILELQLKNVRSALFQADRAERELKPESLSAAANVDLLELV
jgi:hypothetical protein